MVPEFNIEPITILPTNTNLFTLKWIFVAVGFYVNTVVFAAAFSFGSLLNAILDKFGQNISQTATVQAIFSGVSLSAGIFNGMLISRFGLKKIALIGGIMTSLGFILSFLATSLVHLYVCIGVIAGIGTSIMVITSTTAIGKSFSGSKRLLALAIQNAGVSVGGALLPYLFDYFVDNYGLNGNFLLMGGIYMNCLPAAILLSIPYENQMKENSSGSTAKGNNYSETPSQNCTVIIAEELKKLKADVGKIMHLPFILTVAGIAVTIASLNGYFALVLDILKWKGFTSNKALLAFPMTYGVGIIARLLPGITKQFQGVSSFVCPIIFSICGASGQLVILFFSEDKFVFFGCGLAGLALSGVLSGTQIIIVKILDKEQISVGLGLMFSSIGILTMIYGPAYGAIRDVFQSYEVVLYSTFTFQVFGTTLFLLAIFARKLRSKGTSDTQKGQDNLTFNVEE